jgi:outer membrane protein OmpA-like peptidoglycan-associated protein
MTNSFASKIIRLAGAMVLASILATSVEAQIARQISFAAPAVPETLVLFFDVESAALTPEAKSIVLSAVDAAERDHARQIELAAFSSSDEFAHDPALAARRAAAVKDLITDFGFAGLVAVDEEGPQIPLVRVDGDATFDRAAVLHLSH